jgi:adenylate cyclase
VACVGNMGSETRFNYSAVGDAVNVAARIEAACKVVGFDILVSDETARMLPGYALLEAGALPLRGKSGRTKVYAVVGDERIGASPEFADLNLVHQQLIATLHLRAAARRKSVALAKLKAAELGAGLHAFYDVISARSDHFLSHLIINGGDAAGRTTADGDDLHDQEGTHRRGPLPQLERD